MTADNVHLRQAVATVMDGADHFGHRRHARLAWIALQFRPADAGSLLAECREQIANANGTRFHCNEPLHGFIWPAGTSKGIASRTGSTFSLRATLGRSIPHFSTANDRPRTRIAVQLAPAGSTEQPPLIGSD